MSVEVKVAAQPYVPGGPYEVPLAGPFELGMLYSKTWAAPFVNGVNQTWAERCRGYWDRLGERYGYVFSDHRNAYDEITATITTYATPIALLKGDRRPNRRDNN
jgi:hypothetical protein